jgi:hypothetical protein
VPEKISQFYVLNIIVPFYKRKRSPGKLSYLPKVTQPVSYRSII